MAFPNKGSKELRKGRFSQAGSYYFVTASTHRREKLFVKPKIVDVLIKAVCWMEDRERWTWEMYMIMPDHVHLVFQLKEGETLASVMKIWKGYTAREILRVISGQECPSHGKTKDGQECPSHRQEGPSPQPGMSLSPTGMAPLWQEGYYDRLIRSRREFNAVLNYMADNPVRGGLVSHPREYPFWKSKTELE